MTKVEDIIYKSGTCNKDIHMQHSRAKDNLENITRS